MIISWRARGIQRKVDFVRLHSSPPLARTKHRPVSGNGVCERRSARTCRARGIRLVRVLLHYLFRIGMRAASRARQGIPVVLTRSLQRNTLKCMLLELGTVRNRVVTGPIPLTTMTLHLTCTFFIFRFEFCLPEYSSRVNARDTSGASVDGERGWASLRHASFALETLALREVQANAFTLLRTVSTGSGSGMGRRTAAGQSDTDRDDFEGDEHEVGITSAG